MSAVETDVEKVSILGKNSIHCGFHLIPYIAHTVLSQLPSSTYVLITDTNIAKFHLSTFQDQFNAALTAKQSSSRFLSHVIPPGELSKSREGKARIEDFLLLNKCTRDTVVLALGGGVVGDLVGFVAATFMRGVRFCQIPTTLLAMVDSSVGGKTAIDTPHGKNLIGSFWQPEFIFIDAAFLETLPSREFSNGMAEVVKTAAIWNEAEFSSLESRSAEIFAAIQTPSENNAGRIKKTRSEAQELLLSVIKGSIAVKSHIVTIDPHETGLRNLVNFGHSVGHAIEAVLTPTILHGECVSIGMILEAEISRHMGILNQVGVGRLTRCLKGYNLPVSLSDPRIASLPAAKELTINRLLDVMRIDKKNNGAEKRIVILSKIGATHDKKATGVPDSIITNVLAEAVTVIPGIPTHHPVTMVTPGSKSISNRALVLAALAKGTCKLRNLLHSDDTQVMMAALSDLQGASFEWEDAGETLVVHGGGGKLVVPPPGKELYLGNAGTAARFLTTVCTLVQTTDSHSADRTVITGNARMKQRPIGPLVTALRANGSAIDYLESEGCLPLSIAPNGLKGSTIQLAASVSSQYVSSVLLCAPYAQESITLELIGGQVISQPYIDMTIAMMKTFGIDVVRRTGDNGKLLDIYDIPKGTYVNPALYNIESDASSATYPLAIAAITGTTCTIKNIGSASLQGDARFAKEVLERMGCTVSQTPTDTTVTGPPMGQLNSVEEIDMEVMTDAFLTATVLGAVASGKTRIIGIANQRVKECNRIRAMIDELAKFGVATNELDDGLEVIGKPIAEHKHNTSVHCYDDHRVAMAFSVLATVVPGTVLEEKRCVEKTWPNWWDDLQNKIGVRVQGVELPQDAHPSSSAKKSNVSSGSASSIIVVGMRGSGKSYIGSLAASSLNWSFIDADTYFEEKVAMGVREFVQTKGWEAFREAETQFFKDILAAHPTRHVISLGGGIVETPAARQLLQEYKAKKGPVVYNVRNVEEVVAYLGAEAARPQYGEPIAEVYKRRAPWLKECSNYQFVNHVQALPSGDVRLEVERFFGHITGLSPNLARNVELGNRSYFLSLTYPDITPALSQVEELSVGIDAWELRVDLLHSAKDRQVAGGHIPDASYVADQIAALRRASSLPIVYTVRTVGQGGAFPDDAHDEMAELLHLGLSLGVEYVDVEGTLSSKHIKSLVSHKGHSQIIASYHDWSGSLKWTSLEVEGFYHHLDSFGDIVKIISKANTIQDNFDLQAFATKMNARPNAKPLLAINMGREGQMSRILNTVFTPITHPLLPNRAAPGQLSFVEIQTALHLLGQLPEKQFFLLGNPIAHSMSPTLHNTGFRALGLPHKYALLETGTIGEKIKQVLASPDFGGASVTIPFKLDIIPVLDEISEAAKSIGAVNTIIPKTLEDGTRILYGDNTDWLGIRGAISSRVSTVEAALIIGGGGTARAAIYALKDLGAKTIYMFNRTREKAVALQQEFKDAPVQIVERLGEWPAGGSPPNVIVSAVPATETSVEEYSGRLHLPSSLFSYTGGPACVVDMAYKPIETPLLKLAPATAANWSKAQGVEVLLQQGYHQFEAWTGRRAPRGIIAKAVWSKYLS
ncbi:hypothetical protein AAF712_008482 [Marasmius tenuissimus]|uniref:Pentafunctional AROM polypeptide n=1 Tax=Marasmius tenuissimus TaxID=585030 RepID=A0ABR2ZTZ1_9AGAR